MYCQSSVCNIVDNDHSYCNYKIDDDLKPSSLFKIAEKEQNCFVKNLSGKHADEHMHLTSSTTPHVLCQCGTS